MTETDYIIATNLAKLRAAQAILCDVTDGHEYSIEPADMKDIRVTLRCVIEKVEAIDLITPPSSATLSGR